jgi:phage gpG-like protein
MNTLTLQEVSDIRYFGDIYVEVEQAYKAADYTMPLLDTLEALREDHQSYFDNERDANNDPWAPLAKSTIKRKGFDDILIEKGDLEKSLTEFSGDNINGVAPRGLVFGTADEKALWHQEGTARMPARPPVGMTEQRLNSLCDDIADHLVDSLKG